jgi:hypothetical protein
MAKVSISEDLKKEILRKFKKESKKIFKMMYSLQDNPQKGKIIGSVGSVVIKELKYRNFRFYFITNGRRLNLMDGSKLRDLLIKFVRMSDKKTQQKTIDEIKDVLRKLGDSGF